MQQQLSRKGSCIWKKARGNYRMVWREERDRRNDIIILCSQNIKNNIEEKFKSNNFMFLRTSYKSPASLSTLPLSLPTLFIFMCPQNSLFLLQLLLYIYIYMYIYICKYSHMYTHACITQWSFYLCLHVNVTRMSFWKWTICKKEADSPYLGRQWPFVAPHSGVGSSCWEGTVQIPYRT